MNNNNNNKLKIDEMNLIDIGESLTLNQSVTECVGDISSLNFRVKLCSDVNFYVERIRTFEERSKKEKRRKRNLLTKILIFCCMIVEEGDE